MIHARKCEPEYFQAVIDGRKTFEIRTLEQGVAYLTGDFLALNEWGATTGYTGRCCLMEITYVLDNERFVKAGTAVLGIRPCSISYKRLDAFIGGVDFMAVPVYGGMEAQNT